MLRSNGLFVEKFIRDSLPSVASVPRKVALRILVITTYFHLVCIPRQLLHPWLVWVDFVSGVMFLPRQAAGASARTVVVSA